MIIQDLGKSIEEYKARLVTVDSIIALHRAEFTGRGTLAERQQRLNIILHKLSRLAEVHNIAYVKTSERSDALGSKFGSLGGFHL